uniref:Uncharacterized protein n=1 Tax=Anguilla anguilla TaxID=7936 RepID=A0A0E9PTZ9_ANGAN
MASFTGSVCSVRKPTVVATCSTMQQRAIMFCSDTKRVKVVLDD